MHQQYLKSTKLLNFKNEKIQALIIEHKWNDLDAYQKIKTIYGFVQNDIKFGYNAVDTLTASEVLTAGYGQCNTKATLLMALLRAVNIPCRFHGFEVSKDFQKGVTSGLVALLAPQTIIHGWVEVYYNNQWLVLEGVIIDQVYLQAIKAKYPKHINHFALYAIAIDDFLNLNTEWDGNHAYVQSVAVTKDLGVFNSPDVFFNQYHQNLGWLKTLLYKYIGCKIMNQNIKKVRSFTPITNSI